MLCTLQIRGPGEQFYSLLNGKNVPALETALAAFVTRSPKCMEVTADGWAVAGSITGIENGTETCIYFLDKSF